MAVLLNLGLSPKCNIFTAGFSIKKREGFGQQIFILLPGKCPGFATILQVDGYCPPLSFL
jgi:hypothetical protein